RRVADQRLRDADPLQLTAGELLHRAAGEVRGTDGGKHLGDAAPGAARAEEARTPAVPVEAEPHQVGDGDRGDGVDGYPLRHVSHPADAAGDVIARLFGARGAA